MDEEEITCYQPPKDFIEDKRESLIDFQLNDSTELWLIQWPISQSVDFDGQQVELKLNKGRQIGTLEDSSGKSYDMVDVNYQGPEAVVFVPSSYETRIAGKISKHVSLIHYPEASELKQRRDSRGFSQRSSAATSTMSGRRPTQSGRTKSTVTGSAGHSKSGKRKRDEDKKRSGAHSGQSRSGGHSGHSSGRGTSGVSSSGSKGHSEERMSKKRKEK